MNKSTCTIDGCERGAVIRGICQMHYMREYNHGDVNWVPPTTTERFWAKVRKTETCWEWTGAKSGTDRAYGSVRVDGKNVRAHRMSWELHNGVIPEGMFIDHVCHNKSCVNPGHLRLATHKQNNENRKGPQANSASGIRGVTKVGSRWWARVCHNGEDIDLGKYATAEEAGAVALAARLELFTHSIN